MRKTYRYRGLVYPANDNTEIFFTVEFISNGNFGHTVINVPGDIDPQIEKSGTALIGKGADLRSETTISFSDISNFIPHEDEIRIAYSINGDLLVEHVNAKSEENRPYIVLSIEFPQL